LNDQHQPGANPAGNQKPNHESPWLKSAAGPIRPADGGTSLARITQTLDALAFSTLLSSQETSATSSGRLSLPIRGNP
jgi:hypothetical protein